MTGRGLEVMGCLGSLERAWLQYDRREGYCEPVYDNNIIAYSSIELIEQKRVTQVFQEADGLVPG